MSQNAQRIIDVAADGVARLTAARALDLLTAAWVRALLSPAQTAEDTSFDLRLALNLDGSTGAQLDLLGALVGEVRGGRDDAEYKRAISARVQINRSRGERERLITIATLLTGAELVQITTAQPRAYTMLIVSPFDPGDLANLRAKIETATSAGIGAHLVFAPSPNGEVFRLSDSTMPALGGTGDGMPQQF